MKRNYTNPYTLDRKPIKLRDVYSMVPIKLCKPSANKYKSVPSTVTTKDTSSPSSIW